MKKTKIEGEFCSNCGKELIRVPGPAEKLEAFFLTSFGFVDRRLGARFNPVTGMRQFGIIVKCPHASRWNSKCTNYVDSDSLFDSDLPELINL